MMMRYKIITQHADYEKLFGGPSIIVDGDADGLHVAEAARADLIGENIEISAGGDIADQLAAMYQAEVIALTETEYTSDDGDNIVVVANQSPVYTTYTSGTREPLYRGDSAVEAAESLEMSEQAFDDMLAGDGFDREAN
jgi:hypothetical protein